MKSSRRGFLASVVGLIPAVGLSRFAYGAADELAESDPSAIALGYRADATKVEKAKFPKYLAGQSCSTCQFYQGSASDQVAACPLFNGRSVRGSGWCNGYAPKS
jgi:hypothetical protein